MYIPKSFAQENIPTLHAFMQAHSFATLVTVADNIPTATHLPFMLDADTNTLIAHMARANPQWKTMAQSETALVIFQGTHAYISSSLYEPPTTIPTWNYTAVHAYGTPTLIHDTDALNTLVSRLVHHHDPDLIDSDYVYPPQKLKAIVGFTIKIDRLEGKFKLNQNRPVSDQQRVADHLSESGDNVEQAMSRLMVENIEGTSP